MNKKYTSLLAALIFISTGLFAATSFSGYAGGKLNYCANPESKDFDPDLKLQAFFAGQFNFSQNVWSHLEFSIDTGDLLGQSIFHETESLFQIDEISLIFRANMYNSANYFSAFMGTYDPIGSDIFLQRYFNIKPINSKITESYLGLAGSILYPHFGIGVSDIIKLYNEPLAFGGYVYLNHEDNDYYVLNGDLRLATVLNYLTLDLAGGVGIPLADKYRGEDVIIAVEKLYWHAGTTILLGNNFTSSIFLQAGIYNASFKAKQDSTIVSPDDIYILLEPRILLGNTHFNTTLYSLPKKTVDKLLFVEDQIGIDFNIYSEATTTSSDSINFGSHLSVSLIDKKIKDLQDIQKFTTDDLNISVTPYIESQFLSGQLHLQATIRLMDFLREKAGHAFSVDLGYRTKF